MKRRPLIAPAPPLIDYHRGDYRRNDTPRIFKVTVFARAGNIIRERMTQQEAQAYMMEMEAKHPKACMIKEEMEEFKGEYAKCDNTNSLV